MSAAITATRDTTTVSSSSQGHVAATAALDSNMFLKLLVAEIQNQDPTKPMSSAELVQQLASFSQVQQGSETNSRLAAIMDALSLGQAAAVVGRQVTDADGKDLGKVEAVRLTNQGLVARLADGKETLLGQGVSIRG